MRLSPLSVPYRALQKGGSLLITALFVLSAGMGAQFGAFAFLALLVGSGVVTLSYEYAYYRRFEYELSDDTLDIRSGVFGRREREIPYRRIQNVDVSRNVVQRLFGIAAVDVETAGGSSTEAVIRYVSAAEAERLQREVRRRKRGVAPAAGADEEAVESLFELAPRELALVGALSFDPRVPGALVALLSGSVPIVSGLIPNGASALLLTLGGVVAVAVVVFISWVVGVVRAVVNYYGFRLVRSGEELRYERGLLRRYSGAIPLDKVQAVSVEDNPLMRRFGYATLAIETAGYAPGQAGGTGSQAAVPLADADRVRRLANELEPFGEPAFERPPKRIRRRYAFRYLLGLGAFVAALYAVDAVVGFDVGWYYPLAAAPLVLPAAHYKWKHRGVWLGKEHVVTRNGFWSRSTKVVPYYRVQNIIDTRTVFQRRWQVATVVVDTAGSRSVFSAEAAAVDVDERRADELRAELNDRLRASLAERRERRRRRRRFEWVDADALVDSGRSATGGHESGG